MALGSGVFAANLSAVSVYGASLPSSGPQAVPISFDFSQFSSYSVDLSNMQQRGLFQLCQTVFIDASNVDTPVSLNFTGTNQTIIAKGRTQGYYTVCSPNPLKFSVSCPGSQAVVNLILMNYPTASGQWLSQ